uniref:Uncharacterized protein n=1 Tax=Avena sativa TaxID=4498 RepID=A0ACD5UV11_AVESA
MDSGIAHPGIVFAAPWAISSPCERCGILSTENPLPFSSPAHLAAPAPLPLSHLSPPLVPTDLCMAAVAGSKGRIAGNLVARVLAGTGKSASPRRAVHTSVYDKNVDEQVRPAFVPDDVIGGPSNPDKYWGPHPTTGVFGPAVVDGKLVAGAPVTAAANGTGSVLDQKVWFRPLEDVEKPPPVA